MTERRAEPLRLWGRVTEAAALAWEVVRRRLEDAENYWLVTSGPGGRPQPRPVWGVWEDERARLLLTVGSAAHHRNIAGTPEVAVHLDSAHEVVIIEGTVRLESDPAVLEPFVDPYNAKYRWNFTAETAGPVMVVSPRVVLAWDYITESTPENSTFPDAAGRWTFG